MKGTIMEKAKLQSHLEHLQARHLELDKKITEGYTNYITDKNLGKMKQEKLMVKRQIEDVRQQLEQLNG